MFQGMHAKARKGFNVGVPVMEAVDVLVHGGDMDESVVTRFSIFSLLEAECDLCAK